MSALIVFVAEPRIRLPMMNSGTSVSIPQRIPMWLLIQPMSGRTSKPGITHSDATEKPVARARAGIASDNATRMPGPTMASVAEITQLKTTATTMFGETAKPIAITEVSIAMRDTKRISAAMSVMKRLVMYRVPTTRPTNWKGSAIADATPRARSSRLNFSSYSSEASTTKPISAVARNGRLHHKRCSVGIFCTVRQLSANEGTDSSVLATSSLDPMAARSHLPRTGSCIRNAITAKITVGTMKTRNGTRHPNWNASKPATSGPTNEPIAFAAR